MRARGRLAVTAAAVALLASAGTGCSAAPAGRQHLTVLAGSSLTDVFTTLAARFEDSHPGVDVRLSFAGSSTLAQQVVDGAPADVLATADQASMAAVSAAGLAPAHPPVFATNTLVIVTPADNPAAIANVGDLADQSVSTAICEPEVPCGAASRALLRIDSVAVTPVTLEPDVRSVLTKVRLGEVDAGIVYVSDARSAGADVATIRIANAEKVISRYPISVLGSAAQPSLARQFVHLVVSATGQGALRHRGFGQP